MAFIPVPNTVAVHLRYLIDAVEAENILYFNSVTNNLISDYQALGEFMSAWWAANIAPIVSTAVLYRETFVVSLASATAPGVVDLSEAGEQGDVTGTRLPNEASPCISFRTVVRGRTGRGRNYLPPPAVSQMANSNEISSTLANAYTSAYQLLITAPPEDWTWVVVSRYLNNAPRSTGISNFITSCGFTDRLIDSQRRRKPGQGT